MLRTTVPLLLLLCPLLASASDYYVDKTGKDTNAGTATAPWLTINHAVGAVSSGAVVHVNPGVYTEGFSVVKDGTSFVSSGATVQSIRVNGRRDVTISGFVVIGTKAFPPSWQDMPALVVDSPGIVIDQSLPWTTRQPLVTAKYATYMNTLNNTFNGPGYSLFSAAIWVTSSTNVVVTGCTVSGHTIGIDLDGGSKNVTVSWNLAHHCRSGIWSTGGGFSSSVIDSNRCFQNLLSGITVSAGANVTVSHNEVDNNGLHGVTLDTGSSACRVSHNTATSNGWYSETMQSPGSSAYNLFSAGAGNVVDSNYAASQQDVTLIDGNGFIADTASFGVTFTNNVAINNAGKGVALTLTNGSSVVNNTLVNNRTGVGTYASTGNTISGNVTVGP